MPRKAKGWACWAEESGDKGWRARWTGVYGTGQQTFLYKADADELVEQKRREFQRLDAGLPPLPRAVGVKGAAEFLAFKADYIRWLESRRAAGTVRNVRRAFQLYEEFAGPTFPTIRRKGQPLEPGKTIGDFSDWLIGPERQVKRTNNGHRHNGAGVSLRHLKAAMRWGYREGHLDGDPFLNFEFPAAVEVARYLKTPEVVAILKGMRLDARCAAYFTLHTGLRISEVLRLDWADVEVRGGKWYLTVEKSKSRRAKVGETKTQAIHPNARVVMGPVKPAGRVFTVRRRKLNEEIFETAKRLGLGRVRWHDLRHTWATDLMDDVRNIKAVMLAGGWVTDKAAMVYQHRTDSRTDATLELKSKIEPPVPEAGEIG